MKTVSLFLLLLLVLGAFGPQMLRPDSQALPDLIVSAIKFEKVKQDWDSNKNPYWIFNVYVVIFNQGKEGAGKFQVLLTRNIGEGGSYVQACPSCWPWVDFIGPGQEKLVGPFQFNNANGMASTFNAKVDYPDRVAEYDETNNVRTETFIE